MTRPGGVDAIDTERTNLAFVSEALGRRAEMHKAGDSQDQAALRSCQHGRNAPKGPGAIESGSQGDGFRRWAALVIDEIDPLI
jgi:hypothetical protein